VSNDADSVKPYVPTLAEQLTARFYEWEKRGRGWQVWKNPVDLEPAYEPFFHHYPELGPAVDDGRTPTDLSLLADKAQRFFNQKTKKLRTFFLGTVKAEQPEVYPVMDKFVPEPAAFVDESEIREIGVSLFPDQKIAIESAEQFLLGLAGCSFPVSFEIVAMADRIGMQWACRDRDTNLVCQQLRACFPEAVLGREQAILAASWNTKRPNVIVEFGLSCEFMRSLKSFRRLDPDPLAGIIGAMEGIEKDELGLLQVLFQRTRHPWTEDVLRSVTDREGRSFFADSPDMLSLARGKVERPLFAVVLRVIGQARSKGRAWQIAKGLAAGLKQLDNPPSNELIPLENEDYDDTEHAEDVLRRQSHRSGMLLNSQELVSIAHLPSESVRSEKLVRETKKTKAAPAVAQGQQMVLGENIHQGKKARVAISAEQRLRHIYVAGASGTGKSTLLANMIVEDLAAGNGLGLLDPHGDLVNAVLRRIPKERVNDVVLFNPADTEYPFALNILEAHDKHERERIVAETIMALERYFPSSWGPRLERILQYTLRTVLHAVPGATLADVEQMLTDSAYRESVLAKTTDLRLVQFWNNQFKFMPKNACDPVLNKLSPFLLQVGVRNIICQRHASVNFDNLLNDGKILLANLSTGLLTEKVAGTLGSFLVTKIVNAAFRRAGLPAAKRRPWHLYIDEFQNFMNLSVGFERILAESRKQALGLVTANQYLGQLNPSVRQAIFGNVGTLIVFRLGVEDAYTVAKELGVFTAEDILNLEVGQAIARVGASQTAFNLHTFREPPEPADDPTQRVVALARQRYARPRRDVEAELAEVTKAAEKLEEMAGNLGEETSDPSEDDLVT
jgi:hypothetical protein